MPSHKSRWGELNRSWAVLPTGPATGLVWPIQSPESPISGSPVTDDLAWALRQAAFRQAWAQSDQSVLSFAQPSQNPWRVLTLVLPSWPVPKDQALMWIDGVAALRNRFEQTVLCLSLPAESFGLWVQAFDESAPDVWGALGLWWQVWVCHPEKSMPFSSMVQTCVARGGSVGVRILASKALLKDVAGLRKLLEDIQAWGARPEHLVEAKWLPLGAEEGLTEQGLKVLKKVRGRVSGMVVPQWGIETNDGRLLVQVPRYIQRCNDEVTVVEGVNGGLHDYPHRVG